jgi:hypothetical protein
MVKKLLPFLLLGFFLAPQAHAAITFDSSSTAHFAATTGSTSSITIAAGSNMLLEICVNTNAVSNNVTAVSVSSSVAGTGSATFVASTSAGTRPAFLYYWLSSSPTAGTVYVSTTLSASVASNIGLADYFGVNQTTPVDTSTNIVKTVAKPSSTIVTANANEWVLDCLSTATAGTTSTPSSSQIRRTECSALA